MQFLMAWCLPIVFPKHLGAFYLRAPNQLIQQPSVIEGHGYPGWTLRIGKWSPDYPCPSNLANCNLIIIWWAGGLCISHTEPIASGIPM